MPIQVPPHSVQQRITSVLSTIDRTITHTEALIEKYQQIKAGLMHDLFTRGIGADGQLRPTREQAPELYWESAIGWIPKEWDCVRASEICFPVTKGTTPSSFENTHTNDPIPYLRVENLDFDGSLKFESDSLFVSRQIHEFELRRSRIYPGDILMNIVGPPLGKISVVPDEYKEWNTNQAIAIYRVVKAENRDYLLFYLLSEFAKNWFYARSKQTSGQVNLTLEMCNGLKIPLPVDETEISAISQKMSHIFKVIRLENESLGKLNEQKSGLMHDLLTGKVQVTIDDPEVPHD
jgi:type I restriction enzyme, S subunit